MKIFRKNIVLIPADYNGVNNQKGILNVCFTDRQVECTIKCFNIIPTSEKLSVAIMIGDSVFKSNVTAKDLEKFTYIIPKSLKENSKVSCVIICLHSDKENYDTILWGSTETAKIFQNGTFLESILQTNKTKTQSNIDAVFENSNYRNEIKETNFYNSLDSENEEKEDNNESLKISDDEMEDKNLQEYIDKVFEKTEPVKSASFGEKMFGLEDETNNDANYEIFYNRVQEQVNSLLLNNPSFETLENVIESSKFCKVDTDDGYYVFGLIYDNENVKYLCYGVPAENNSSPPKELEGYCQWLPTDSENSSGFWISYQDAVTGKNVKMNYIT